MTASEISWPVAVWFWHKEKPAVLAGFFGGGWWIYLMTMDSAGTAIAPVSGSAG